MSLGDFLGDETFGALGSWADEVESLPTAPAQRAPGDAPTDRYGRGGDREFSRPDRAPIAPREDLPLPTAPPFIAYVGNLPFDLVEDDLGQFFAPESLKSIKVIRDRDDKPKGFGYVEFETLDGLKSGLSKSGAQLNSRTVRFLTSSIFSAKDHRGTGPTSFGDESTNWRRDGPLPSDSRGPRGSRFDDRPPREPVEPSEAEVASDWRSNQPVRSAVPVEPRRSGFRDGPSRSGTELNWERKAAPAVDTAATDRPGNFRKGSGFSTPAGDRESAPLNAAETDDAWRRGPPRASIQTEEQPPKRGAFGGRSGEGSGFSSGGPPDAGDWRSQMRVSRQTSTDEKSPTNSQPQTPQGARRQLNLLPRSSTGSNAPSPLSSPRMANSTAPKASPFGAARPVDVSNREREVSEKLEKERESRIKEKTPFGNSRPGTGPRRDSTSGGPPTRTQSTPRDHSPAEEEKKERTTNKFDAKAAQVRAQTSFAAAAGAKKEEAAVDEAADKLGQVTV
ncbi:Eukaryotic translation initiation factor 4B [Rhizoctonia solani]